MSTEYEIIVDLKNTALLYSLASSQTQSHIALGTLFLPCELVGMKILTSLSFTVGVKMEVR